MTASFEPTQDVCFATLEHSDLPETVECWGRLLPLSQLFQPIDLVKNEITFGRGDECDCHFNSSAVKASKHFNTYSKLHFALIREATLSGYTVFLEDRSSNGTFVNGSKIGKNQRQALTNNDEVALSMKTNRVFIFVDQNASDKDFPEDLRKLYTVSKVLGRGACGEVRLAFEKGTCNRLAIKVIEKKRFTIGGKNQFSLANQVMTEVNILKLLKHPCIIQIKDVIDTPDTLFIVLELVEGGELFDRVVQLGQFDEATAKLLFYQMVLAVKYLHDQGITHRDLKPENILLASESNQTIVKVTDFGLSKLVESNAIMKTFCGTPNYLAPEVLLSRGEGIYTNKIDCWSLGVILYICLVGYPPFTEENTELRLTEQIIRGQYKFHEEFWKGISEEAKDLVTKLLTVNPEKRYSLEEALNHAWLQDVEMRENAFRLMYPADAAALMGPPTSPRKRNANSSIEEVPSKRTRVL